MGAVFVHNLTKQRYFNVCQYYEVIKPIFLSVHETRRRNSQNKGPWRENRIQRKRRLSSAGNVMARGIIFNDYLETGKTLNGEYYASDINNSVRIWWNGKWCLITNHDNAPVHTFVIAMARIRELMKFILLPHSPNSPEITPSNYFFFPNLKMA